MTSQYNHNLTSKITKTLRKLLQPIQPNGTILIAINNDPVYQQYFGFADIGENQSTSLQTQYLIASITKQFSAAALLNVLYIAAKNGSKTDAELEKNVTTALQKAVSNYLPRTHEIWANSMPEWADTVTLHQLLVHSSGIPNYTSLPGFDSLKNMNDVDIISIFKIHALEFVPGTKFSYTNSGYFMLGTLIQEISGQPFDQYLQTTFFNPLEMHSTHLPVGGTVNDLKQHDSRFSNLARGYTYNITVPHAKLTEVDHYTAMQIPGSAGGLVSTVSDLLIWNNALYGGKILPSFLVNMMLQSYIQTEKQNEYYGYGIEIKNTPSFGVYYTHRGGIPGFQSRLTYIPAYQLSIVISENVRGDKERLYPEIEAIKLELPKTLPESELSQRLEEILESKYPSVAENRIHYQLTPLEDSVINVLANSATPRENHHE
ncbi:Penicillin-binding protein 4* [Aquicella siphonis]|uniref:Penicillin-binding protein 4 n=1 Tax=Aquicella siphonis TaxID=254247 RepID=A0A5E4PG81_9COXI|nr:serine hydrolase domain-containing protein [Aquicella siphonis]VVC75356.1 Penicillin-binding protein 4* [Aquicella siphonis]